MILRQRLEGIHGHKSFQFALDVVNRLQKQGYQTVFAGGCVRDSLLSHRPKDLDIATAAPPEAVEAAFPRTLAVGKAFGTIVVMCREYQFEVTTFRTDGAYKDGRHPESVAFSGIEEDARRRDFTVNALFYDPLKEEVLDFVQGLPDLRSACLRTVGDPQERFREDHLRMLRAVRFVGQLGFTLEASALNIIQKSHNDLAKVSVERIFNEIQRLLTSKHLQQGLQCLRDSKLYEVFWPEFARFDLASLKRYPSFPNWENAFAAIQFNVDADPEVRLRSWKVSRESLRRIQEQLHGARKLLDANSTRADRARILGGDTFAETLNLALAQTTDENQIEAYVQEFLAVASPLGTLPQPFVNGQDLLKAGVPPGEKMGRILKDLFDAQLEGKVRSKTEAMERLKKEVTV